MDITSVVIRRRVGDLDAASDFYERLTGSTARRFAFGDADLDAAATPNGRRLVARHPDGAVVEYVGAPSTL